MVYDFLEEIAAVGELGDDAQTFAALVEKGLLVGDDVSVVNRCE